MTEWCDCEGCREWRAVHDGHCPEIPREERAAQRKTDADARWRYEISQHEATHHRGAA